MSPEAGLARINEIEAAPAPYGNVLMVTAFALTSGAVARFLGGGLHEIGVGVVIGIVTGLLAVVAAKWAPLLEIYEPVAACRRRLHRRRAERRLDAVQHLHRDPLRADRAHSRVHAHHRHP